MKLDTAWGWERPALERLHAHERRASDRIGQICDCIHRFPSARIGAFFIPGIGTADDLKSARAAGLDFVRIGYNAPEIEQAYPYIDLARNLGLIPCLNFMKTYGVTPQQFAAKAKGASWPEPKPFTAWIPPEVCFLKMCAAT